VMDTPAGALLYSVPFTLGHENAGWVEQVGPGVDGLERGEPVIVYSVWGCGRCANCRVGAENYCEKGPLFSGGGLGQDGGMASHMLVPSPRFLCPLGDLDPRQAAPLTDAGLTTYHAIKRSRHLLIPGSTAVVIGAGGLGQMAIQILKAVSPAQVVAVDLDSNKLAIAQSLGADLTVIAGDRAAEQVRDATQGLGAELVLDIVGSDATLPLATAMARRLGHLTVVGIGGGSLMFNYFSVPTELSVASVFYGSIPDLVEVTTLARTGRIRTQVELYPLEQAPDVYERLRQGKINGRAVITPNG